MRQSQPRLDIASPVNSLWPFPIVGLNLKIQSLSLSLVVTCKLSGWCSWIPSANEPLACEEASGVRK